MSDCCCNASKIIKNVNLNIEGEYICYCNKVTEQDIKNAILSNNCKTVKEVISFTGAMKNSNCAVNNPKGTCCYQDIVSVFNKYSK
ncbi:(2Fe-2S)-binding protein [Paraclostridium sordellii]|uniref:(2Fe-2S)-binding protein n=1 Tax=Paraclostridium sordellii TaxID=1505 RepID=UPI0005E87723|nr:(2Fe-2S)-binding protein [Paeniclostridium sordellii]CEO20580.1 arsenical resistance operon trans-acting repressor ArsD [[Clostridium] sordellii] [Paeniclostridium sordellii]